MNDLRKAAQQALKALKNPWFAGPMGIADAITALEAALAESQNPTPIYGGHLWFHPDGEIGVGTPAKSTQKWQGLTDQEIEEAMLYWSDSKHSAYGGAEAAMWEYFDVKESWRYIEAKLKEKNT